MKKKKCYSLTYLGSNLNGGNNYQINSMIWLTSTDLSAEELAGFATYIQAQIRRVWSTENNPGLRAGLGPYRYNRTNDWFTCFPQGLGTHTRDTGVIVRDVAMRPTPILRDRDLQQSEILFTVFRMRQPGKRAFIDPINQTGELYYYAPPPLAGTVVPGVEVPYNPVGQTWYKDVHNTAAHEFGHALGLKDRYHYLAFGHHVSGNGNTVSGSTSQNWISRHAGGDVPMYLPGLFDSRRSGYNSTTSAPGFSESAPPYNQPVYLDPSNSAIPSLPGASNPQPDFNPTLSATDIDTLYNDPPEDHRGAYDIEYTTLFGWQHNIMSRKFGVNDPGGESLSNRFNGQYSAPIPPPPPNYTNVPLPADPLYTAIYGADAAGPTEVVLITQTQTNVITDTGANPDSLPLIGEEIKSKRFEDEIAESHGFPKGMFDQFCFIIYRGATFGNVIVNAQAAAQIANPNIRGVSPEDINGAGTVNDYNKQFYNSKSGGTFLGIHYVGELDKDGKDNGGNARIVTDWNFDNPNSPQYANILGVSDCMDYRMSKVLSTAGPGNSNNNKWQPEQWSLLPSSGNFYGFINPNLSAKGSPKSKSRQFITGKANVINRVKNIELDNLSESFFTGFPTAFQNAFNGGLERINYLVLAFGSIDALRFLQRVFEQVQNPTSRFIIDGQFRKNLDTGGIINFAELEGQDMFADCGIATPNARALWNGWRNDWIPPIPNPQTPAGWIPGTPYTIVIAGFGNITVTPWVTDSIDEHGKYIIQFATTPTTLLAGSQLLPKYELIIRHFSNRLIIDMICSPS